MIPAKQEVQLAAFSDRFLNMVPVSYTARGSESERQECESERVGVCSLGASCLPADGMETLVFWTVVC